MLSAKQRAMVNNTKRISLIAFFDMTFDFMVWEFDDVTIVGCKMHHCGNSRIQLILFVLRQLSASRYLHTHI